MTGRATTNPPRPITIRRGHYGYWEVCEPHSLGWHHQTNWPKWEHAMEYADKAANRFRKYHRE